MREQRITSPESGVARYLDQGIQLGILSLAAISPWLIGGNSPIYEFWLTLILCFTLTLWAFRILLERRLSWRRHPALYCLCGLFLFAGLQVAPVSKAQLEKLSPKTAELYERLLPATPEVFADGDSYASVHRPTISVYPGATRREMIRLLSALLIFAVAFQFTDADKFRLLCGVLVANGAALALFGMVQAFMNPTRDSIYWSIPAENIVFGPFVNRSHYAMYVNLCINVGLGLFISNAIQNKQSDDSSGSERISNLFDELFMNPKLLWLTLALALMVVSVPFSFSRGGTISLLASFLIWLLLAWRFHVGRLYLAICGVAAGALVSWIGWQTLAASRLNTIWTGEMTADLRLELWSKSVPLLKTFPIFGTGAGTFEYVEPMYLGVSQLTGGHFKYAHNEYLEALAEGGVIRFAITLALVAVVLWSALRKFKNPNVGAHLGLLMGAFGAIASVAIHSFVEFGIHMPAIAIVTLLIAANICAVKTDSAQDSEDGAGGFFAALLMGGVSIALGILLAVQTWNISRAEQLKIAADRFTLALPEDSLGEQLFCLRESVRRHPHDAQLRLDLAMVESDAAETLARLDASVAEQQFLSRSSLNNFLQCRDLCPMLAAPHLWLAENSGDFAQSDGPDTYIARAKFLSPDDAFVWYGCGLYELRNNNIDDACASWKHSLTVSGEYLDEILSRSTTQLDVPTLISKILPADPRLLLASARKLFPGEDGSSLRRPFLNAALPLLDPNSDDPEIQWTRANVLLDLGEKANAIQAINVALSAKPDEERWLMQLARLQMEADSSKARNTLRNVLELNPNNQAAKALLKTRNKKGPAN